MSLTWKQPAYEMTSLMGINHLTKCTTSKRVKASTTEYLKTQPGRLDRHPLRAEKSRTEYNQDYEVSITAPALLQKENTILIRQTHKKSTLIQPNDFNRSAVDMDIEVDHHEHSTHEMQGRGLKLAEEICRQGDKLIIQDGLILMQRSHPASAAKNSMASSKKLIDSTKEITDADQKLLLATLQHFEEKQKRKPNPKQLSIGNSQSSFSQLNFSASHSRRANEFVEKPANSEDMLEYSQIKGTSGANPGSAATRPKRNSLFMKCFNQVSEHEHDNADHGYSMAVADEYDPQTGAADSDTLSLCLSNRATHQRFEVNGAKHLDSMLMHPRISKTSDGCYQPASLKLDNMSLECLEEKDEYVECTHDYEDIDLRVLVKNNTAVISELKLRVKELEDSNKLHLKVCQELTAENKTMSKKIDGLTLESASLNEVIPV